MLDYEKHYTDKYKLIAGVDEAGRGPLAGPVVCCAVILPSGYKNEQINDSKKLTELQREKLFDIIIKDAVCYSIVERDHNIIDRVNILNATKSAMNECIATLAVKPEIALIDAVKLVDCPVAHDPIIKGDAKSLNIAAASILAKVTRDRLMLKYDKMYPEYLFYKNKGYGTPEHINLILKYGLTDIHRRSFTKNIFQQQCEMTLI